MALDFEYDFDFDFNMFDDKPKVKQLDICGIVEKMQSKDRMLFDIDRETTQLDNIIDKPPTTKDCYKMISTRGGFSSIGIIKYIADLEPISELYVLTFRIGLKQFNVLDGLYRKGRLSKAHFITSSVQKETDKTYDYFSEIAKKCKNNKWELQVLDNHAKVILVRTKKNHYVVETSSNLNENPKMEQFNWENDKNLYSWYEKILKELFLIKEN